MNGFCDGKTSNIASYHDGCQVYVELKGLMDDKFDAWDYAYMNEIGISTILESSIMKNRKLTIQGTYV